MHFQDNEETFLLTFTFKYLELLQLKSSFNTGGVCVVLIARTAALWASCFVCL